MTLLSANQIAYIFRANDKEPYYKAWNIERKSNFIKSFAILSWFSKPFRRRKKHISKPFFIGIQIKIIIIPVLQSFLSNSLRYKRKEYGIGSYFKFGAKVTDIKSTNKISHVHNYWKLS